MKMEELQTDPGVIQHVVCNEWDTATSQIYSLVASEPLESFEPFTPYGVKKSIYAFSMVRWCYDGCTKPEYDLASNHSDAGRRDRPLGIREKGSLAFVSPNLR